MSSPKSKYELDGGLHSYVHTILCAGLKDALLQLHMPCKLLMMHWYCRHPDKSCKRLLIIPVRRFAAPVARADAPVARPQIFFRALR